MLGEGGLLLLFPSPSTVMLHSKELYSNSSEVTTLTDK